MFYQGMLHKKEFQQAVLLTRFYRKLRIRRWRTCVLVLGSFSCSVLPTKVSSILPTINENLITFYVRYQEKVM